jgi:copper chaperone CopZ
MTKVDVTFRLARPLDEILMTRIAAAHGIYGITRVRLSPTLDEIAVEFDASRLAEADVEAALHRAGIAAAREH